MKPVFVVLSLLLLATNLAPAAPVDAATALVRRVCPTQAGNFICETIPADTGKDVFEIESQAGKIVLRGNSPLSVAVGLNWYLKYYCHCSVSLNGSQLNFPRQLPAVEPKVRQAGWASSRYFLNYCTFSYSMSWWDWKQWEFSLIGWHSTASTNRSRLRDRKPSGRPWAGASG